MFAILFKFYFKFQKVFCIQFPMPAVHSRRVHLARFLNESYMRWDCASATFYPLAVRARRGHTYESENKACALWLMYRVIEILDFFFQKLPISPNALTPVDVSFRTPENIRECWLKKNYRKQRRVCVRECIWFWCVTRGDSQTRHKTLWLRHHRPLKKRESTRWDATSRGYTRASEARRVFPFTFSLLRCLGFSQRECTADIRSSKNNFFFKFNPKFLWLLKFFKFLTFLKIFLHLS